MSCEKPTSASGTISCCSHRNDVLQVLTYVLPDGATDPPIRGPAGGPVMLPWLDPGTRYEVRDVTPGPSPVDPTESASGGGEPVELVGAALSWPDRAPPSAAVRIVTRRPS